MQEIVTMWNSILLIAQLNDACDLQVKLTCSTHEVLSKVEEPSRCEYTAELSTPAMCSPEYVKTIHEKAAQMALGHDEL